MKKLVFLLVILMPAMVFAEEQKTDLMQQSENSNVFKGMLYKVWNKFRSMTPVDNSKQVKNTVVTVGIRGAETTSSLLKPYWKNDRTGNADFIRQLEDFTLAQDMIDNGDLSNANAALLVYMTSWPESELMPNANFALAMTYGGMGNKQQSIKYFENFVNDYPEHPLAIDAKILINELKINP